MSTLVVNDDYAVNLFDGFTFIVADGLLQDITVTLPSIAPYDDQQIRLFNKDASFNMILVAHSGEDIVGGTITLGHLEHRNLYSYSSEWYAV